MPGPHKDLYFQSVKPRIRLAAGFYILPMVYNCASELLYTVRQESGLRGILDHFGIVMDEILDKRIKAKR